MIDSDNCLYVSHSAKTWLQAQDVCRRYGGTLLEITTAAKKQTLDDVWDGLNVGYENFFIIEGDHYKDKNKKGQFYFNSITLQYYL